MRLAKENGCKTIAFPLISAGVYGYPKKEALKIAVETVSALTKDSDMDAYIVIYEKNYAEYEPLLADYKNLVATSF